MRGQLLKHFGNEDSGLVPNIPPFILANLVTIPSINGPATKVPRVEATKEDMFTAPTAPTEKLYGGAEKI
jgi:hypothetical protein